MSIIPPSTNIGELTARSGSRISTDPTSLYFGQQVQIYYDPSNGNLYEFQLGNSNGYTLIINDNYKRGLASAYSTQITSLNNQYTSSSGKPAATPPTIQPATLPPPVGDQPAATLEDATSGAQLFNLEISGSTLTRSVDAYPKILKYPISMKVDDKNSQDHVTFTMLEYRPRKFSSPGLVTGNAQDPRVEAQGKQRGSTVILPIQPTISDSNSVRWGSGEMDAFSAIAASIAMNAISQNDGFEATAESVTNVAKLISGAKSDFKTALAAEFAGRAASVKGLLTRATGGIINPNLELLFEGPDLRTFNFTFSLSAREPNEAKVIRNIIRFFKQGMSVKRASTGLFLKSPHTFQIRYIYGKTGDDHPWINRIKECALTSCNVNYTPAGNYATYEDGAMTQYDLTLSFSELEPIYDDDYGKGSTTYDSEIGY